MAALLGLFWRLLREGRLKVARGRSWQPEIGMEHASRGRRSGNKGVGARWRGRFRIFSARHCSRTKVSHAENSGMTMLFFSWRLLRCRRGMFHTLDHHAWPRERQHGGFKNPPRRHSAFRRGMKISGMARGHWFLFFLAGHSAAASEKQFSGFFSLSPRRMSGTTVGRILPHALERPHTAYRRWTGNTRG